MYALTATIGFEDCICSFDCGFETFGRNWLEISGTDGGINVNQFTNGGGFTGGNYFTIARAGEKEPERVEIEQELSNQARMVEAFSNIVLGACALDHRPHRLQSASHCAEEPAEDLAAQPGRQRAGCRGLGAARAFSQGRAERLRVASP